MNYLKMIFDLLTFLGRRDFETVPLAIEGTISNSKTSSSRIACHVGGAPIMLTVIMVWVFVSLMI